jgi:glycosyltransferase involved in cell wall biosynthesis
VGSGPLETAIRSQIAALPDPKHVQLLPFCQLEELGRHYGQASVFVLASSSDQWGLVVNEAMAAGLPCLVSSACGCAFDLVEHGTTGWCFDPTNPADLTQLMHTAERQPPSERVAMVAAARDRLQAFSPEAFAAGLQQALDWAVARPRFSRRAALTASLLSCRP